LPNTVDELHHELDIVNFDLAKIEQRLERLNELIPHSQRLAKENSDNAGFQMMAGFFNAQYAGYKGGVGALKYAKASRKYLDKSVKLDPTIYGGAAHIILGTLYVQVPGWPVGFGSKKKALTHYQAALKISPDGLDSNLSYAEFLFAQKEYSEAKVYLEKAAVAPSRPKRAKADARAKKQIARGLELVEERLADAN